MDDIYQEVPYSEPEPKKGMSGWLIVLIVVAALLVVCCLCLCLSFLLGGPAIGSVFSTVVETLEATTPMP
jgi:flagellar basal body-associated protein FliL